MSKNSLFSKERKSILSFVSMGFELVALILIAFFLFQNPKAIDFLHQNLNINISLEGLILILLLLWFISLGFKIFIFMKDKLNNFQK